MKADDAKICHLCGELIVGDYDYVRTKRRTEMYFHKGMKCRKEKADGTIYRISRGIAVIKDENKKEMAMMKLANYEDKEVFKAAAEKDSPNLPFLPNNEKRKGFLKGYKNWRVWFEVPEAGETYYRYNLPDGSGIVAKEYRYWASWKEQYSDENPDSIGVDWYLLKPGYKYLHNCKTSEGAIVDHLRSAKKQMDEGV